MIPMLADARELIPIIAIGGGIFCFIVWIIATMITTIVHKSAEESTRRELAAYIAEGSMTTEEAERILKAGRDDGKCSR
ncbi:MAG: hypothetical protein AAF297_01860 [Planctomycetota bacterium]